MSGSAWREGGPGAVWSHRVAARWMLITGGLLALAFLIAISLFSQFWLHYLGLLAAAVAFVALGAVRVTVTSRDVSVRSIPLPLLRRRIPLTRVCGATARHARPMELGGWGYRWRPRRTAVSLRAGDALFLQLTNGREFVVTVDDAARAAQAVNGQLAQGGGQKH